MVEATNPFFWFGRQSTHNLVLGLVDFHFNGPDLFSLITQLLKCGK